MTADYTLRLTLAILSIPLLIESFESLYYWKIYQPYHWLSWNRLKYNRAFFRYPVTAPVFNWLFRFPNVFVFIVVRILLCIAMLVTFYRNSDYLIVLYLLTLANILFTLRNAFSNNGADQLSNVILMAASISTIDPGDGTIKTLSVFFIAVQVGLAYFISGFNKINKGWLNGTYMKAVLSTEIFGNRTVLKTFSKATFSFRFFSVIMIVTELLLAFCILFPPSISVWLLLIGVLFHLVVACIMGFNTFLFTFLAAYPAVYFISFHGIINLVKSL